MSRALQTGVEPDVVYHYTSLDVLTKILKSRSLRATNIAYLNDTKERNLFLDGAIKRIPRLAESECPLAELNMADDALSWEESPLDARVYQLPYVVSFSRDGDSLPQWRAYASGGQGVAIGFSTSALRNALVKFPEKLRPGLLHFGPPVTFGEVTYLEPSDVPMTDAGILRCLEEAKKEKQAFDAESEEGRFSIEDSFRYELEKQACFYKDDSFKTEAEFRLVVGSLYSQFDLVSFHVSRSTLVPYVEIDLSDDVSDKQSFARRPLNAIKEVVIGPTVNPDLNRQAVEMLFRSHRMRLTPTCTEVPYRDW